MFDFGNVDLSTLLGQGGVPSLPRITTNRPGGINPNMAPPKNFWDGDKFNIGAPGMQATEPGQAPPVTPSDPMPQPPTIPHVGGMPSNFGGPTRNNVAGAGLARNLVSPHASISEKPGMPQPSGGFSFTPEQKAGMLGMGSEMLINQPQQNPFDFSAANAMKSRYQGPQSIMGGNNPFMNSRALY